MSILRVVAGVIIGVAAIIVFLLSDLNNYHSDVRVLLETAQGLGYTKDNQLKLFRFQGSFPSSNDDTTTLVFSTSDSLNTFSEKVEKLGLEDHTLKPANGKEFIRTTYVTLINDGYSRTLFPADLSTDYSASILSEDIAPRVTRWHFLLSQEKDIRLRIEFARLPNKNLFWKDKLHQKTIAGPIVVMEMNR